MKILTKYYPLLIIIILAGILRFWGLSSNPPGLTWDEAALGYNAYSLLQTGKDEYGQFMPLNLKSFGDWKPAVYAYLTTPFVGILGLNEFSVRFPSAFLGIVTVLLIFILISELFNNRLLALLSAFFLSISPWHIQFSRGAFEVNVALFLNILGAILFLKKKFIYAAFILGLSIFTYQGSRLFVPLLIIVLMIIYRKFLVGGIVLTVIVLLVGIIFLTGQTNRLTTQNFFAYQRSAREIQQISYEDNLPVSSFGFQTLHGEWFAYARGLVERYLIYFSPKMLFVDGDYSQRHKVPDLGVLYFFSVILIPLGIIYFLKKGGTGSKFLFLWLLVAPIPGVLSRDLISTLRTLNMVLPVVILEAGGMFYLLMLFKKLSQKKFIILSSILIFIIGFNFVLYLDRLFIHSPKEYSQYWLYGYKQVLEKWSNKFSDYNKVIITDSYGQPYIYYLFFNKYLPQKFQAQAELDQPGVDVGTVRRIDNIEFRHIYWPADRGLKNTLFIGPEEELPSKDILPFKEFKVLDQIKFLNGEMAFKVVETL